jgi:hypothetical protein
MRRVGKVRKVKRTSHRNGHEVVAAVEDNHVLEVRNRVQQNPDVEQKTLHNHPNLKEIER